MPSHALIDAHQHLLFPDRLSYGWTTGVTPLRRAWSMADYRQASAGTGITASIHVEVDVDEADGDAENRYLLDLAEDPSHSIAGVVAVIRPEHDDFRRRLDQIAGRPGFSGVRRLLQNQPDDLAERAIVVENLRSLPAYGVPFDLCVTARQLPLAIALVHRCPHTAFVLDHCGNPDVASRSLEPWRSHIQDLARCPNVVCKISGLVTRASPEGWTADDLRPYIEHVIDSFGWDRVLFGSDWPVCTLASSLSRWLGCLTSIVAAATPDERQRLFCGTAMRVYRLAPRWGDPKATARLP